MNLHILGSNSFSNCYILESRTEALIIEAGVRMADVKKALRWQMNKVVGCVVTHEHNDHAGHVADMVATGVRVLALQEVFNTHGLAGKPFTKAVEPFKGYRIGGFLLQPVPVQHDVPCVGWIIQHADMGKLLFITDTVTFGYRVDGLNVVMIEANYADDIVAENIANGSMPEAMRPRLLNSHMEIGQTKAILADHDLTDVNAIVLVHLSDGNADEERFIREVQEQTGKTVYAANAGMTIDISKTPY